MKRLFAICGALLLCSYANAYDFEVDGIYYNILSEEDKTCEVTQTPDDQDIYAGTINIPNNANGYTVTSIGSYSFSYNSCIVGVIIPNSVTKIDSRAFEYCSGLNNITIPNSVTYIGLDAFEGCPLKNLYIPNSVISIGSEAFTNCVGLESIHIPNSIKSIGFSAFEPCLNLNDVYIELKDESDFSTYISRTDLNIFHSNGLSGLKHTICINGDIQTSIEFPNNITSIGSYAFCECSDLTQISIPENITSIGDKSFYGCSSLMSVTNYATTPQPITETTFPNQGTLHVLNGYGETYKEKVGWKNFLIKEEDDTVTFADGTQYSSTASTKVSTLKYTRTFSNNKWQALYIPFSMSYSDFSADLDVAWLNNVHMYDDNGDNTPDRTTLEFYIMDSGSTEPNTPYLVRAHTAGTSFALTLSDVDVSPAVCNPFECSTFTQTFTVYGTYTGVTGADMVSNKYYAPSNGSLCYTTNTSASLKPQRWYLKVANKDGSAVTNLAPSIRVMIDGEMLDEEETAISRLEASQLSGSYVSIDGRSVADPTAPGLYVHNNKKIFVR